MYKRIEAAQNSGVIFLAGVGMPGNAGSVSAAHPSKRSHPKKTTNSFSFSMPKTKSTAAV
jgi:hypothetical protein